MSVAFIRCCRTGNLSGINDAIKQDGNFIDIRDNLGFTPLIEAILYGQYDTVRLLLNNGAEVNARNNNNWTGLMYASSNGRADIVHLLIQYGADHSCVSSDGYNAMNYALMNGNIDVVDLLITKCKFDTMHYDIPRYLAFQMKIKDEYTSNISLLSWICEKRYINIAKSLILLGHVAENNTVSEALNHLTLIPHKIELAACYKRQCAWMRRKCFIRILVENGYYPLQSRGVTGTSITTLRHERVFGDHNLLVQIMSFL